MRLIPPMSETNFSDAVGSGYNEIIQSDWLLKDKF